MRLTKRDGDIFRFLLEQKFATLEAIYFRFFDRRKQATDPLPKQFFVTRQRLGLLHKAGLLTTERVYSESKSLYLLTTKGYHLLRQTSQEPPYAIPAKTVDFRSYVHDLRVTYCRVALERGRRAFQWVPERQIRMKGYHVKGENLTRNVIPDGMFISSKGQRIAFELESSDRKMSRFEAKAHEYRRLGQIDHVLWIACESQIQKKLSHAVRGDTKFTVGTYGEFARQLFPEVTHAS